MRRIREDQVPMAGGKKADGTTFLVNFMIVMMDCDSQNRERERDEDEIGDLIHRSIGINPSEL
jgi:hypothetical protein